MDYSYSYTLSQFPNGKCDISRIVQEIHDSSIVIALDYVIETNGSVFFYFKAELSDTEEDTLYSIVSSHSGEPLPGEIPIVRADILTEGLQWVEAGDTTQAFFSAESLMIDVSAGESQKIVDFSWPFVIALKSGTIFVSEDMIGDELEVHVAPNTLVGYLTAPLAVGDTSMYVSDTVIQNVKKGYYIGLYQSGDTGIEIGRIISVDSANDVLQIYPSDVSAGPGSLVAFCSKVIPYLYLSHPEKIEIGKQMPTGQRVPANIPIRVIYKNNNGLDKKVSFFIEYLY